MKKRVMLWLLALVMVPIMSQANVTTTINGINYELNTTNYTATVLKYTSGSKYSGDIVIPETVKYSKKDYTVSMIDFMAFYDCDGMTSLSIPNTVYFINRSAFQQCTGLKSIELPSSLRYLYSAFEQCTGLTSIHIPASVFMIENGCFYGCTGLTEMTVDSENEYYESPAGSNCIIKKETKELVAGCKATVIPDDVLSIGDYAFRYMTDIVSIDIPNSVTSIGGFAFGNIDNLSSVVIPNSVTTIGYAAFVWAEKLEEVSIGKGITSIQLDAFGDCSKLKTVKMYAVTPPAITYDYDYEGELDAFSSYGNPSLRTNIDLYVPSSAVDTYKNDAYWGAFKSIQALPNKCEKPAITFKDGKYSLTCETEGVEFKTTVSQVFAGNDVQPTGLYTLSVVATKDGYEDSDAATMDVQMSLGKKGDVNADGKVSITDAVTVVNLILAGEE